MKPPFQVSLVRNWLELDEDAKPNRCPLELGEDARYPFESHANRYTTCPTCARYFGGKDVFNQKTKSWRHQCPCELLGVDKVTELAEEYISFVNSQSCFCVAGCR